LSQAGTCPDDLKEQAVRRFCERPANFPTGRPYNCCESILLTLADAAGLESSAVPRIGTAIGAGVSLNGLLCGAISGVAILIGAMYGRRDSVESPLPAWDLTDRYVREFITQFGAVNCGQLTKLDLKTPDGLKEYFTRVHDYECTERIRFAIEKAADILSRRKQE